MNQEFDIFTETMAKVYADQNHWAKVVQIYRHLLAREPTRLDYKKALAEAETKLEKIRPQNVDHLVSLFREWIELVFRYEKLQKLKQLKNRL